MPRDLLTLVVCSLLATGCGKPRGTDLDGTGVAECDDYLAQMAACASKLPAELRAANQAAIKTARDLLEARASSDAASDSKDANADPRHTLTATCQQMASALSERPLCR
jgi:hypothetical protein